MVYMSFWTNWPSLAIPRSAHCISLESHGRVRWGLACGVLPPVTIAEIAQIAEGRSRDRVAIIRILHDLCVRRPILCRRRDGMQAGEVRR